MRRSIRIAIVAATAAAVMAGPTGCAAGKQAARTMIQQGVETTSAGPHDVVPANDAQNAVDALNGQQQQTQQGVQDVQQGQ